MAEKLAGITAEVYRSPKMGDCTNGGESSRVDGFTIVGTGADGEKIDGVFDADEKYPAARIVEHRTIKGYFFVVPQSLIDAGHKNGGMYGGNLISCSDSRIMRAFGGHALKIHDRIE